MATIKYAAFIRATIDAMRYSFWAGVNAASRQWHHGIPSDDKLATQVKLLSQRRAELKMTREDYEQKMQALLSSVE